MALPINIEDLLNRHRIENNRIEFKAGWNPADIYQTICAFATDLEDTGGGYILIGVEQDDNGVAKRPVKGLPLESIDGIQKGPDLSISNEAIRKAKVLKTRKYRNRRLGDFLKELNLTEGRATGIPTVQKSLRDNGSGPAVIETDENRTCFLISIPRRTDFETLKSFNEISGYSDFKNRLGHEVVQVQNLVNESDISNKILLGQLLGQLYDQVWRKTRMKDNVHTLVSNTIDILIAIRNKELSANIINSIINFGTIKDFKRKILSPLISFGYIEMTLPDKPRSSKQSYRLTELGRRLFDDAEI